MLTSATIYFREVFEIVLIVGIILAATKGLPGRNKWIYAGFGLGLIGSALVAVFTNQISEMAEGLGQELFNALILFTAAFFIGWTAIWIQRHAHEMKARFTKVSDAVKAGDVPAYSLALVIALAVLREGAEMVLFTYGMLAAGQPATALVSGAVIGLVGGLVLGLLIYKGLISISPRYFLKVTGALLVLLVAGLVSQGVGMLVAAGYFEQMSTTAWNSDWLLSDQGIVGETLAVLVGYTTRPTYAQLAAYSATLGILLFSLYLAKRARQTPAELRA